METKICLVGTGGFSKMHAKLLEKIDGVRISGICGTSLEKASMMAAGFEEAHGYDQLGEMLDKEKPDAVYLCVPPMAHGEMEIELASRNIPFFTEKPLAVNEEIPRRVSQKILDSSLITSVGYQFRYQETVEKLKELLQEQTIGMISGKWNGDMPGVKWWQKQATSGGQFIEQTTHIVDLLRYVAGEVETVSAYYGKRMDKETHSDVADVGTVNLKLTSGAVANIMNTCMLPTGIGEIALSFYTETGIITWTPVQLSVQTDGVETIYKQKGNPYLTENRLFIDAVRKKDDALIRSDYADACKTQEVTVAAWKSAEKEAPCKVGKF